MLPFQRILFPVDYSEPCLGVVADVKEMVRHFHAELTLVHAFALQPSLVGGHGAVLVYTELADAYPRLPEEARALEARRLRDFASSTFPEAPVEAFAEEGEAGTVIESIARNQRADLVMMPTRGAGPLRRLLLGSVTAKVLHDISAAVWTGAGAALAGHVPGTPYRSILCAVYESDEAEAVVRAGAALASSYQARLAVMHALEMQPSVLDGEMDSYRSELLHAAELRLRELMGRLGIDAPHAVVNAMIADAVREQAVQQKADLVVTGRGHSQGGFSRIWSGLYAIVRDSTCPVLSI